MTTLGNKLRDAGWSTHISGKWDAGIATPDHTPEGRGFNTSLTFAEHMVDSYTQTIYPGGTACTLVDPAIVDLWSNGGPASGLNGTGFIEDLFLQRVLDTLNKYVYASAGPPVFILWTPKSMHYPLMVPQAALDAYAWVGPDDEPGCNNTVPYIYPGRVAGYACRRQAWALLGSMDTDIGTVVDSIVGAGLWNETLIVFSSDNGAPLDLDETGGNNYPLRGGKYANWQGGVRVPALVSGGFLPPAARGTTNTALAHVADWYSTLLGLAGVDPVDHKAAGAGLPPIDSMDLWPWISRANATSPRTEVPISPGCLISWPFKLVRGWNWWSGYTGPVYPNATSASSSPDTWTDCGTGCVYDLLADPFEQADLAPSRPDLVASLGARLDVLTPGFWTNNDTGVDACPPGTLLCGCWAAVHTYGGYLGPYQL